MKILSLDTAMAACSAAIIDPEEVLPIAASFAAMERGHAEALPPMVAEVMRQSGLDFSRIDRIAVTTGPGTFTGVRIGLAFARGLGLACGLPVIGIDTLSAIAANEIAQEHVLVVADARNGEIYASILDADRKLIRAPHITTAAIVARDTPGKTLVLGTAADAVIGASGRNDFSRSQACGLPVAAHFGRLAAGVMPGGTPEPLYLRAPDAKPQLMPLRKIGQLRIEEVGTAASPLLSTLHGEVFDEGWTAQIFAEMLETPGTEAAVALAGEEPLGFIVTRSAADEAEVITLAVRPSQQRRGVARQLLQHRVAQLAAHGICSLFLEVAASNIAAQGLYRTLGFADVGRRKAYYKRLGGVEDAIVMRHEVRP